METVTSGFKDAKYMFVAEALGEEEDTYRRPLIGVSGFETYKMLEDARWLPPGSSKTIIAAFHPWFDPIAKRMRISNPNFIPLDKTLEKASIFLTNVCHIRPPNNDIDLFFSQSKTQAKRDGVSLINNRYPLEPIIQGIEQLRRDIEEIRPTLIIALGGTALWALTGLEGIMKWRGSILTVADGPVGNFGIKCIPTFHSAWVLREWSSRFVVIRDLKRALYERTFPEVREKKKSYIIRPSYREAVEWMEEQSQPERSQAPLGADIETPWGWWNLTGHIACIGFATSRTDAICIPLMTVADKDGYWTPSQEVEIVLAIRRLLTSRPTIFHNGTFDVMHIARHWGYIPRWTDDTMVMQHVRFPGLMGAGKADPVTGRISKKGSSLSLVFCASIYCEYYRAWKDDGKNWNQKEVPDEDGWWFYNGDDCTNMFEIYEVLREALHKENLWKQYRFMMSQSGPVLDMMMRGFPLDLDLLRKFRASVSDDIDEIQEWIDIVLGEELNTGSSVQMMKLFYDDLRVKKVMKGRGKSARVTLDADALEIIAKRNPVLGPLCYSIIDQSSLLHFKNNMLSIKLDARQTADNSISLTGTETLRFASTKSPFGTGLNLMNLNRMPED